MEEYITLLKDTNMFLGITEPEIRSMLGCLGARIVDYSKNEFVLRSGDPVHTIGLILSGQVIIVSEDVWGNRAIISEITPGMLYAESYACLEVVPAEISVIASTDTRIMLFDMNRIITTCASSCGHHTRLIQNLLGTISRKNIRLTEKMSYLSKKTIRDRLLSYLSSEALKSESTSFTIPFDRQELADFLSVDRSALSSEIGKLQKEGLIECKKNHFVLHTEY